MTLETLQALNIIEKRAEVRRMNEEVREELLYMIGEIREELEAIYEGAVENEKFHTLEEGTDLDFDDHDKKEVIDWEIFRSQKGHKEDRVDENFKPKRDPNFYAMDQFNFAK